MPHARTSLLTLIPLLAVVTIGSAEAQVTILEVGPHGTYTNIQDAINVVVSGDNTEIRVEGASTYYENLVIDASFADGELALLGGWNMTFTDRVFPPQDTIIDANQDGRVIDVFMNDGDVVIDGFTITNGREVLAGGGVRIDPFGDALVTLANVRIIGNTVTSETGTSGGGLQVELYSTQRIEVLNCRIKDNYVVSTGGGVLVGGGINIRAIGDSSFLVQGCEIDHNSLKGAGQLFGAGVSFYLQDNAQGELLDTSIPENNADGSNTFVSGVYLEMRHSSLLNVERVGIGMKTTFGGGAAPQLWTSNGDTSSLRISDSLIGMGDQDGMKVRAYDSSTVNLTNLTVADNAETGISVSQPGSSATMTLYNTISFGNLVDFSTSGLLAIGSNLIGVDPLFVNPAAIDYHLGLGSPAENAGDNTIPGGLGLFDFDGNPRIKDGTVDIGCYEGIAEIFNDGFESGGTLPWSNTVP